MFSQTHGLWGERLRAMAFEGNAIDVLWLQPHKRSSWHKHTSKCNRFVCLSGKVGIKTDKGHTTILTQKQMFEIEPGIYHEFQTYEDPALLLEVAYVKLDENDIQRETVGGSLDGAEL